MKKFALVFIALLLFTTALPVFGQCQAYPPRTLPPAPVINQNPVHQPGYPPAPAPTYNNRAQDIQRAQQEMVQSIQRAQQDLVQAQQRYAQEVQAAQARFHQAVQQIQSQR